MDRSYGWEQREARQYRLDRAEHRMNMRELGIYPPPEKPYRSGNDASTARVIVTLFILFILANAIWMLVAWFIHLF